MVLMALTLTGSTQEAGGALLQTSSASQPWCRCGWAGEGVSLLARGAQMDSLRGHMSAALSPGPAVLCVSIAQTSPVVSFQTPKGEHLLGAPRDLSGPCLWAHPELPLQDLAKAFQQEAQTSGKERLLLSAAVPAGRTNIDAGYEVDKIAQ